MQIIKIPKINEEIFSFRLYFRGMDIIPGDRHFLEHLLLNSNEVYNKDELCQELTRLGLSRGFILRTNPETILISANLLKKDAPIAIEILNSMINDLLFLNKEVNDVRKTINHEFLLRQNSNSYQINHILEKFFNFNFEPIGSLENINHRINTTHLKRIYKDLLTDNNAILYLHNGEDLKDFFNFKESKLNFNFNQLQIEGEFIEENPKMKNSWINLIYNEKKSLDSLLLARYLNNINGPFFKIIREKTGLSYVVQALTSFQGLNLSSPFFNTLCISSKDPDLIINKMTENFTIDEERIYNSIKKENRINLIYTKKSIKQRMNFERIAFNLECTFNNLFEMPTWEEFQDYANSVKDKLIGKIIIKGYNREQIE